MLTQHFGIFLGHALFHKDSCAILNDKRPAHDLHTDIEELRNHPFTIAGKRKDASQCREEIDGVRPVGILRHLHETDQEKHRKNDDADDKVRRDQDPQVILFDNFEPSIVEH